MKLKEIIVLSVRLIEVLVLELVKKKNSGFMLKIMDDQTFGLPEPHQMNRNCPELHIKYVI